MGRYIFERGEYFDDAIMKRRDKRGLIALIRSAFPSLQELERKLEKHNSKVVRKVNGFEVPELPFVIRELPVYYFVKGGEYQIGKVRALDVQNLYK